MNQNDNKDKNENTGLSASTGELEHIREIENIIEKRSSSVQNAPVRKYVRKKPADKAQDSASQNIEDSTIVINRVSEAGKKSVDTAKAPVNTDGDKKAEGTKTSRTPGDTAADSKVPGVSVKKESDVVLSRRPAVEKAKKTAESKPQDTPYTPLLTEDDDFEIDDNPMPENRVSGAASAFTSVAKAIIYLVAVLAVSITLAVLIIGVANDVFAFVKSDEPVTVVVPENCDTKTLAKILEESGAIEYSSVFSFYIKLKNMEGEYLPGTYEISPMLNYDYMIKEFKPKAPVRSTVVVTIPEGYSTDQIINLLIEKGLGTYEGYKRAINEYEFDYPFLADAASFSEDRYWRLDGYLYPDTYYYYSDATEETVIYKMLENFNSKFTEEYYTRAQELGMTVDEIITLASMIQKEVRYADEFADVSSVFHNRLNNPATFPHLDSDATIVYAIEHETGTRPESLSDTSYESPYNTYKCIGLPPGPISNPSLEAIRYAMYPKKTSFYYFVSGKDGRTTFSTNYSDHLKAINELYG